MKGMNLINHKCPCCGYEVEYDYKENFGQLIKGDEPFLLIENPIGKTTTFETDKCIDEYEPEYQKVYLLGCPKCSVVSFIKC